MREDFDKMRAIAQDIIDMSDDLEELALPFRDKFHELMRKHGLRWGIKFPGRAGTTGSNAEWTMAKDFYMAAITQAFHWTILLDIPGDLLAYEEDVAPEE